MNRLRSLPGAALLAALALGLAGAPAPAARPRPKKPMSPIQLHPDNSHYFLFRGRPTLLVTSAEHYGAVLNTGFDYQPYLAELERNGFNLTRIFTGAYVEPPGAFKITHNTLAPLPGRLLCPWARSGVEGYAGGGTKFDLTKWDDAYFTRLKAFLAEADRRGVVVEVVLFCPYYEDAMWNLSPLKAANNVNGIGEVPRTEVLTLKHPELLAAQEAMVRKIAAELAPWDNWYYEVCNEPYFGGVTLEWQDRIIRTIQEAESGRPERRHLIAQNVANGSKKVETPNPGLSIFNFHYASPPDAVRVNYGLNRVIGFDETGFKGTGDLPYRTEGWDFLLAGGGVYNHLDYSFTTEHPDGTAPVEPPTPGGGGPALRAQLKTLKEFLEGFDFLRMAPMEGVVTGGVPSGATVRVLGERGKAYALYLKGGGQTTLSLDLPAGKYRAEWVNPRTGAVDKAQDVKHGGGSLMLESPSYTEDAALRLLRRAE